jgi:phosphoglycolate phosphatase/AHBA synthesis associated protein
MPAPRAILFDMDGVLVKSEEAWFQLVVRAGELFRGQAVSREEFFPNFGQGTAADVGAFGFRCSVQELDAFYVKNFATYGEHVWVNPEAAPLLTALREKGLPLAVVTNTVSALAKEILEAAKLEGYFDTVVCADEVPFAKPAPDLVLRACSLLGIEPHAALMIGDSRYDRGAAEAAGVRFVGLGLEAAERVETLAALLPLALRAP